MENKRKNMVVSREFVFDVMNLLNELYKRKDSLTEVERVCADKIYDFLEEKGEAIKRRAEWQERNTR